MATRAEPRFRKRIPCELRQGQRVYAGFVLNLSRTGLFVKTTAAASAGDEFELSLSGTHAAPLELIAQVVWQRRVSPQLRSVTEGGLGLRISYAPETYYALLYEASRISR